MQSYLNIKKTESLTRSQSRMSSNKNLAANTEIINNNSLPSLTTIPNSVSTHLRNSGINGKNTLQEIKAIIISQEIKNENRSIIDTDDA
jgi:hypothetical protein